MSSTRILVVETHPFSLMIRKRARSPFDVIMLRIIGLKNMAQDCEDAPCDAIVILDITCFLPRPDNQTTISMVRGKLLVGMISTLV